MKQYSHILSQVYNRPLLITPDGFNSIHMLIQSKLGNNLLMEKIKLSDIEDLLNDNQEDEPVFTMDSGLAYIPIYGVIGNHLGMLEKACGGVDIREIKGNLDQAVENPLVNRILLDINSPGGSTDYIDEVSKYISFINQNEKEVIVYTPNVMASAGYYLASGASEIYSHPAAGCIGSIGVYMAFLDSSVQLANDGLSLDIISKGKYKTQGMPGTKLSDDFRNEMQKQVDTIYQQFVSHVTSNRKQLSGDSLEGLTFTAQQALDNGFIDGVSNSWEEIFN